MGCRGRPARAAGRSRSTAAMTDIGELPWNGRRQTAVRRTAPKANTSARATSWPSLLRRHVGGRPDDNAGGGHRRSDPGRRERLGGRRPQQLREAEVEHFHLPAPVHEDVPGLHIAMDDAGLVRRGEGTRGLDRVLERQRHWHRRLVDQCIERAPVHELHRDERHLACGVDVVDVDDVRVIEREADCASCTKRRWRSGSAPAAGGRTLMATVRFRRESMAR